MPLPKNVSAREDKRTDPFASCSWNDRRIEREVSWAGVARDLDRSAGLRRQTRGRFLPVRCAKKDADTLKKKVDYRCGVES